MSFESLGFRFIAKLEDIFLKFTAPRVYRHDTAAHAIYQVLSQYLGCFGARAVIHLKTKQAGSMHLSPLHRNLCWRQQM